MISFMFSLWIKIDRRQRTDLYLFNGIQFWMYSTVHIVFQVGLTASLGSGIPIGKEVRSVVENIVWDFGDIRASAFWDCWFNCCCARTRNTLCEKSRSTLKVVGISTGWVGKYHKLILLSWLRFLIGHELWVAARDV